MALSLTQNLDLQSKTPNFARDQFKTLAAMKAYPETSLPEGHLAYCLETSETYQYKSANTADAQTGKWRVFAPAAEAPDLSAYATKTDLAATDKKAADAQTAADRWATFLVTKLSGDKGWPFDMEAGKTLMTIGSDNSITSEQFAIVGYEPAKYSDFMTAWMGGIQSGYGATSRLAVSNTNGQTWLVNSRANGTLTQYKLSSKQVDGNLVYTIDSVFKKTTTYEQDAADLAALTARVAALEKSAASAGSTYE